MKKVGTLFLLLVTFIIYSENLEVHLDKTEAFTGEEIELKIPVAPGREMSAFFNSETSEAAIVEVVPDELNEKTIVKLVVLDAGLIEVPEMTITVEGTTSVAEGFSIEVKNRTEDSDVNIRDIKDTVKIFEKDYFLLWVLISIVVLAALIYLIRKLLKRRKKEVLSSPLQISPLEIAEKYIREAVRKRKENDIESFVDLVTIGMRDYMSSKQGVNYKEMTTSEVRKHIRKDKLFSVYINDIIDVLRLGDKFKFADEELSENDLDILINGFRTIVGSVEKKGGESESA